MAAKRTKHQFYSDIPIIKGRVYIYVLFDLALISRKFYVGKSNAPKLRLNGHFSEAKTDIKNKYKNNWIKSVLNNGGDIAMKVIYEVPIYLTWQQAEKQYISIFKNTGIELVNTGPGGEIDTIDKRGSKSGRALLNEGQVIEIIKLIVNNVPTKKICEQFNIKPHVVQYIRKGATWNIVFDELLDEDLKNKLIELRNNKDKRGRIKTTSIREDTSSWNKNMKMSEEFCLSVQAAQKKRFENTKQWNTGISLPEEQRRKLSEMNSGEGNPFYGKKHSDKSKNAISKNNRGKGGKLTETQVIDILIHICDEVSVEKIHEKYSFVSENTIRRIKSGRVWAHVIDLLADDYKNKLFEIRAEMLRPRTGERNPFFGKHHSEESKRKRSAKKKMVYIKTSKTDQRVGVNNINYRNDINDEEIIKKYLEGKSAVEIAEEMNKKYRIIYDRMKRLVKKKLLPNMNTKPARHKK